MKHIPEVDGLRAVAVLSVLLFHVHPAWLPGGFVGVDIFFVISGYLITGIILADLRDGNFSLANFYKRRILRIAPALFVTLLLTALVFSVLTPPSALADLRASLIAATLSYANFWFYLTVDYFGDNALTPVLHTWSLAVEEQFYFVFPLLMLALSATSRQRWRVAVTLALALALALAVASFVAACILAPRHASLAFYMPWLRAWELMAGSLLAMAPLAALTTGMRRVLSIAGLLAIGYAIARYRESMVFPGLSALLPVAGAVAVIAGAGGGGVGNLLLRFPLMQWVGKISYSLYLVHWPLVCLASLLFSLYPMKIRLAILVGSVVLGWLSWRYVEQPFRRMNTTAPTRRVMIGFPAACAALLLAIPALQLGTTMLWQQHPEAVRFSSALKTDASYFRTGICFLTPKYDNMSHFQQEKCLGARAHDDGVLVIGDSHAANLVTGLAARYPHLNVLQATAAGCRPTYTTSGPAHCVGMVRYIYDEWLPRDGAHVRHVVIAGRWEASDLPELRRAVAHLRSHGKDVVVVGPSLEYYVPVPLILAYEQISGLPLQGRLIKRERLQLDQHFRRELAQEVTYFSPNTTLCSSEGCRLVHEGAPTLFDRDHFTPAGVELLVRDFPLPASRAGRAG
ncbi:acyltransferase family protein [Uliginosibacterium sp. H1]|uniref:acyltransferase family protein n=1 Tax=Uliginosibacterium sp. H1 TaxID=3114757 RepID=UPI002E19C48D|nr:acyltransferase family protein [Uliginosibacterium sp. H1]